MEDNLFSNPNIVAIGVGVISVIGGYLIARYTYRLQYRKTKVLIKQSINQLVDPTMLIKPEIVFKKNEEEHRYKNLFIVQTLFFNKTMKTHESFHINVTIKIDGGKVIFANCKGRGGAHKGHIRQDITFENWVKSFDVDLQPFHGNNRYSLTLYVDCPVGNTLNINDVKYDSTNNYRFIEY
jgi:hypothetical protein